MSTATTTISKQLSSFELQRMDKTKKHIKVGKTTNFEALKKCIISESKRGKDLIIDCVGSTSVLNACKCISMCSVELSEKGFPTLTSVIERNFPKDVEVITFLVSFDGKGGV